MSYSAVDWAFEQAVKGSAKPVLVALAYSHNQITKRCFPSLARISHLSGVERKAVQRGIKKLVELGLVEVTKTLGKSSNYVLKMDVLIEATSTQLVLSKEETTQGQLGLPTYGQLGLPGRDNCAYEQGSNKEYNKEVVREVVKKPKRERKKFVPPTLSKIREYVIENDLWLDCEYFFNFYDSNDWRDSNDKPVKSWKGKVRSWHAKNKTDGREIITLSEEELERKNPFYIGHDAWYEPMDSCNGAAYEEDLH